MRTLHILNGTIAVCVLFAPTLRLHAQDNHGGKILVLKDPTPRSPDLEKLYPPASPRPAADPRLSAYNQRRYTLITHTSEHIASLASLLQRSLAQPHADNARAQQAKVAEGIATLAADISGALTGHTSSPQVLPQSKQPLPPADENRLHADAVELENLSENFRQEVAKSSPNALPAGVVTKSVRVRDLALSLQQRLQAP